MTTWLITGASSGLGRSLALVALAAGHKVVGTTRDVARAQALNPDFTAKGGIWTALDPGHTDSYQQFAKVARDHNVDVLVNCAGYAMIGALEDTSEEEVRAQMEANYFGPLRAVKACLPLFRGKKGGDVVLISSGAGFIGKPSRSSYAASKFAIEAAHEALAAEVASFGIKVLIVEPGAFRTPFASNVTTPSQFPNGFSDAYKGTPIDQMMSAMKDMGALPDYVKGDPDRAASVIFAAVVGGHGYLRLPLGKDCVAVLEGKIGSLQGDLDATRALAESTDVDA